jgi:hypothetical protein
LFVCLTNVCAKLATFGLFFSAKTAGPPRSGLVRGTTDRARPSGRRRSIMPPSGACKSCGLNAWRPRWDGKASTCVACGVVSMVSPPSLGGDASAAPPPAPPSAYPWEEYGRPTSPNGALLSMFGERDNAWLLRVRVLATRVSWLICRLRQHMCYPCIPPAMPAMHVSLFGVHHAICTACNALWNLFSPTAHCAPNTTASTSCVWAPPRASFFFRVRACTPSYRVCVG